MILEELINIVEKYLTVMRNIYLPQGLFQSLSLSCSRLNMPRDDVEQ